MVFSSVTSIGVLLVAAHVAVVKQELDRLQGTWRVLTNESLGSKLDEEYNRRDNYHVIIKGNTWGWRSNSAGDHDVAFRIDPARKPKWLDLDIRDGEVQNESLYELDGDDLHLCIGHGRPGKFAVESGISVLVLKRVKK